MPIRYRSAVDSAAYHDLRRVLLDAEAGDIVGTPTRVTVKGREFWYDKYRIGHDVRQRYIGPDTPELGKRLERWRELAAEREALRRERTRLVRLLRSEGYATTDARTGSLLAAFSRTGVFRLGGTLIGTMAFRHYEGELGVVLQFDELAQTGDLDIGSFERLSLAIGGPVDKPLVEVFSELRLRPLPSPEPGKTWRWAQAGGELLVEFLMPAQRDEGIRDLPALGVSAQALRYLDFLLESPIPAASLYRSGILIQIPRPERFAIHKLIVAERRQGGPDALKARKDRAQAAFLIEALAEQRPDELLEAYEEALDRGPSWRTRMEASLAKMPEAAGRIAGLSE